MTDVKKTIAHSFFNEPVNGKPLGEGDDVFGDNRQDPEMIVEKIRQDVNNIVYSSVEDQTQVEALALRLKENEEQLNSIDPKAVIEVTEELTKYNSSSYLTATKDILYENRGKIIFAAGVFLGKLLASLPDLLAQYREFRQISGGQGKKSKRRKRQNKNKKRSTRKR